MPRFRPTARLLVLDPAGRVLMFSAADPRGRVWFTPGGGVRRGESGGPPGTCGRPATGSCRTG